MLTGVLVRPELQCRMGGGDDRRQRKIGFAEGGRCGGPPSVWIPRVGSWCSCERVQRVRRALRWSAASNCSKN